MNKSVKRKGVEGQHLIPWDFPGPINSSSNSC